MTDPERDFSAAVTDAIWSALAANDRTREPVNALCVWTELGRGLAGTLERKGADLGALLRVIDRYTSHRDAPHDAARPVEIDLARWIYQVPAEARMTRDEVARRLIDVEDAIARSIAELLHQSPGNEGEKTVFLTVVKGWFPVGVQILRTLPAGQGAPEGSVLGALGAWCRRYLPQDPTEPRDLGIRVER